MREAIIKRFGGLLDSIRRYPLTVAFLMIQAVLTASAVGSRAELMKYIVTCAIGALSAASAEAVYERFFNSVKSRILAYVAAVVVTGLFFLSVRVLQDSGMELVIRTFVTGGALFVFYVWIAAAGSAVTFNETFMAAFKSLVQSILFAGVLFLGCAAIIAAINTLIVHIDEDAYLHASNIAFTLFAPILFFSLIPRYPGKDGGEPSDIARKRVSCPRVLEVLLSYIVIPLTAVFTVILLIYIVSNIGGAFWTDNLLEPLLVSYTVIGIVVTILSGRLENQFAVWFNRIFPKALIPIAGFQIVASALAAGDTGVTPGSYYVILYGVFAVLSGLALSILPMKKSGVVAALLVALSIVSLVPPVDAFSLSAASQINTLETTLTENGMLVDGQLTPYSGTSAPEDKDRIVEALRSLDNIDKLDRINWLPEDFSVYDDAAFFAAFGFNMYTGPDQSGQYISVYYDSTQPLPVTDYDVYMDLRPYWQFGDNERFGTVTDAGGKIYTLRSVDGSIALYDDGGAMLVAFALDNIYARYTVYPADKHELNLDEATFTADGDTAGLKIIVQTAQYEINNVKDYEGLQLIVLVDLP